MIKQFFTSLLSLDYISLINYSKFYVTPNLTLIVSYLHIYFINIQDIKKALNDLIPFNPKFDHTETATPLNKMNE